jgi:hypothetical protein
MWTTLRLAHIPTAEQNQKKRTNHVLPKPDKLIRYRQRSGQLLKPALDRAWTALADMIRN